MSLDSYSVKEIRDICKINDSSYSKKDNWNFFNYLDTKNITKGEINEIKYLDPSIEKIPSRAKRKVNIDDIIISTVRPNQEHYGMIKYEIDSGYYWVKKITNFIRGYYKNKMMIY